MYPYVRNNSVDLSVVKLIQYSNKIQLANDIKAYPQVPTYSSVLRRKTKAYTPLSSLDNSRLIEKSTTYIYDRARSKRAQYLHHEQILLDDVRKLSRGLSEYTDTMECMKLPSIHSPEPPKPNTLYDRAIQKHRLQKLSQISSTEFGTVDIIPLEDGGKRVHLQLLVKTSGGSAKTKTTGIADNDIPILRYEHDGGSSRNLPGQPELIKLLFEAGMDGSRSRVNVDGGLFGANSFLNLYGNLDTQMLDGVKRKVRRKKRELCNFCGNSPKSHQKWCVFYNDNKDTNDSRLKLVRSHTDLEIKRKKKRTEPEIGLERSKTTFEQPAVRHDLPDYSSLHRDVYIHALAVSRAKRVLKGNYDFSRQLTEPFVFSYFPGGKKDENKDFNEMKHIFGRQRTNIAQYYEYFANKAKQALTDNIV